MTDEQATPLSAAEIEAIRTLIYDPEAGDPTSALTHDFASVRYDAEVRIASWRLLATLDDERNRTDALLEQIQDDDETAHAAHEATLDALRAERDAYRAIVAAVADGRLFTDLPYGPNGPMVLPEHTAQWVDRARALLGQQE
jgi:hypothetical protein